MRSWDPDTDVFPARTNVKPRSFRSVPGKQTCFPHLQISFPRNHVSCPITTVRPCVLGRFSAMLACFPATHACCRYHKPAILMHMFRFLHDIALSLASSTFSRITRFLSRKTTFFRGQATRFSPTQGCNPATQASFPSKQTLKPEPNRTCLPTLFSMQPSHSSGVRPLR